MGTAPRSHDLLNTLSLRPRRAKARTHPVHCTSRNIDTPVTLQRHQPPLKQQLSLITDRARTDPHGHTAMSATKLTRKQCNRIAADRSRRKRQDEHNRLKERVRELEVVNELLKRENERLTMGSTSGTDALLSPSDLLLLRRLSASYHGARAPDPSACAPDITAMNSNMNEDASTPFEDGGDMPIDPTHIPNTNTSEEPIDSATTSPTNVTPVETPVLTDVTGVETRETGGDFKPAALGNQQPLQKEHRPSLVSLRRNILIAMMAPKIAVSLRPTEEAPLTR